MGGPSVLRTVLLALVAMLLAVPGSAGAALPASAPDDLPAPNGPVYATAWSGSTLYMGGSFTQVGQVSGTGASFARPGGSWNPASVRVQGGVVNAVVGDGSGGWFIGGTFTAIDGVTRNRIAHVRADGTLDPDWNPDSNNAVQALVRAGSTLYVGGSFTVIGGQTRNRLAALETGGTGGASDWDPNANNTVMALALDGTTLYAGGTFGAVGGQTRSRLAALDTTVDLNMATAWDPGANNTVRAIAVVGTKVFVGGDFTIAAATARLRFAAIDAAGAGAIDATIDPAPNNAVYAIEPGASGDVFIGGLFTTIGAAPLLRLARMDATTGVVDPTYSPAPNNNVRALARDGASLFVAGDFTTIGGQVRNRAAELSTTTGLAAAWDPNLGGGGYAIAAEAGATYVGGTFTTIAATDRANLVAIDTTTGTITPWNPNANGIVRSILLDGTTMYVGGDFTSIGGQVRNRLATLDTTVDTNMASSWNPNANNSVTTMALDGTTLYAGGSFTAIGGQLRNRLAALDTTLSVNQATAWNPNLDNTVWSIARNGANVIAAGQFLTVNGGTTRNRLAALDTTTGTATAWDPNLNGIAYAVVVDGSLARVGGAFTTVGAATRRYLAAIDLTTGAANAWHPQPSALVNAIAVEGSTVYLAGNFTTIGSAVRRYAGAVSATGTSNVALAWDPNLIAQARTITPRGDGSVALGGDHVSGWTTNSSYGARYSEPLAVTSAPSIAGTPQQSQALTCSGLALAGSGPVSTTFRWLRDGTPIGGATSASYVAAAPDVDRSLRCETTSRNGVPGASVTSQSAAVVVLPPAPTNSTLPTITGTAQQGRQLTCETGTWTGSPTSFARQWMRNAAPIAGETASAYVVGALDVGANVTCRVTATNAGGASAPSSSAAVVPTPAAPQLSVDPAIVGIAREGQVISCTTGTWTNAPASYAYRWLRAGSPIGGATSSTYSLVLADVGVGVTCEVTASNAGGSSAPAVSGAIAAAPAAPNVTVLPGISGTAQVSRQLTCGTGSWTGSPTSFGRTWERGGVAIPGETGLTYTVQALDVAQSITCTVTATNAGGASAPSTSAAVVPVPLEPVMVAQPAITGVAQQGQTVACTTGTWTSSPSGYAYRWLRAGTPIGGATSSTYTLVALDVGASITCEVTASNAGGAGVAAPSPGIVPISLPPSNTAAPTLLGTVGDGRLVTCTTGSWTNAPTTFAYEWLLAGAPIGGETQSAYTVQPGDVGQSIACRVTASNAAGAGAPAASASSTALPAVPEITTAPSITGTAQQNAVVSCGAGTWTNAPSGYARQWRRDGAAIPGETSTILLLTLADVGRSITCDVVATNAGGSSAPATSGGIVPVPLAPSVLVPPSLAGAAREGSTLGCVPGTWANAPTAYTYEWQRGGAPIPGETSATYVLAGADVGQLVRCTVAASNDGGTAAAFASPAQLVLPVAPVVVAPPVISGTLQETATLSCTTGTWSGAPSGHTFRWLRGSVAIPGATAATHLLSGADVAQPITCEVTASNAGGASSPAVSAPVVPAPLAPSVASLPLVVGAAQAGRTVACEPGAWDRTPTSYAYRWLIGGTPVPAATSSSFTLRGADVGQLVTCEVTASNAGGMAVAASAGTLVSAATAPIPAPVASPELSGRAAWDGFLACTNGAWANAPYRIDITWLRDNVPVAGRTGAAIALDASDIGHSVGCMVTATNDDGSAIAISRSEYVVGPPPGVQVPPRVSGTPRVGEALRCEPGRWDIMPQDVAYAWTRNGRPIEGADRSRYNTTNADLNAEIGCVQTVVSFGSTSTAVSTVVRVRVAVQASVALRARHGHAGASQRQLVARRGAEVVAVGIARTDSGRTAPRASVKLTISAAGSPTITRWLTADARGRFRTTFRATASTTVRAVLQERGAASLGGGPAGSARVVVR